MNLYLFTDNLTHKVSEFMSWWELKHDENPTAFPLTMNEVDWQEQFLIWESLSYE